MEGGDPGDPVNVLDVLDALDRLREQLSSIPRSPPHFDMSSDEEEAIVLGSKINAARASGNANDEDDDESEDDDDEDDEEEMVVEAPEPPARARKKRRRSNSSVESETAKKKKGRPPGSKNKNPTKAAAKAALKAASGRRPALAPDSGDKKKRDPYMTTDEDYYLASAFVNVSENPIFGNNQTGENFWLTVATRYNELAIDGLDEDMFIARNANALKNRFKRLLSPQVMLFNRFWKEARNPRKSGWTEQMYNDHAKELFLAFTKKPFLHDKCIPIMHKMPKFNPETSEDAFDDDPSATATGSDGDTPRASPVNAVGSVMGQNNVRPQGMKAAKAARYKKGDSSNVMEKHVAAMMELNKSTNELSKTIQRKANQESEFTLAMMNYKMGNLQKSKYHMAMAAARNERWRDRENEEEGVAAEEEDVPAEDEETKEEINDVDD